MIASEETAGSRRLGHRFPNGRRAGAAALAAAALLLTAACADRDRGAPAGSAVDLDTAYGVDGFAGEGYGDTGGGAAGDGADGGNSPAGQLALHEDPELGAVLTDGEGFTLYRFEEDGTDPAQSLCVGACASAWPPVSAADATVADGLDVSLLGEVIRQDGTSQLTVGGRPVYRYSQDALPGDVNGHGVGGTWYAVGPEGEPAGRARNAGLAGQGGQDGQDGQGGAGEAAAGAQATGAALSVVQDPVLGPIVADAQGRTLYRFTQDTAWPMVSHCTGACLDVWKPAAPVDAAGLDGVDPELISVLDRPDGTEQLAIDCWPVYWYTGDTSPGDTGGHNAQGMWFAVTPEGKKAPAA
ncbi:SCO0930 family lipoprotein [Streptomyces aidingensis]|uniref:Predicted lipoprotein with conserved Yx(FWY)xxD motif n=1 Tax=Streptomyces aidingensis TaxID=910347 RepID=A0A1I1JGW9_9ACTN|nr:SCO0930 family lipoprotein [Streptomyces aidingensis]SFC45878.1 Predicted lipoprotein with conserved Yx(FWY)xxD motif [Streptomyces aidingensis]